MLLAVLHRHFHLRYREYQKVNRPEYVVLCLQRIINVLFGKEERPDVCASIKPSEEMCGKSFDEAYIFLEELEKVTAPADNI